MDKFFRKTQVTKVDERMRKSKKHKYESTTKAFPQTTSQAQMVSLVNFCKYLKEFSHTNSLGV